MTTELSKNPGFSLSAEELRCPFREPLSSCRGVLAGIGVIIIILHLIFFYSTTKFPIREAVEGGYYQRGMAGWYVPMSQGDFKSAPAITRARWWSPMVARMLPFDILDSFLIVTYGSLAGSALVLLWLFIRFNIPLSAQIAGLTIYFWSYACRYAFFNPFVPDGFRYLSLMLILAGGLTRKRGLIWVGSMLAAINHESVLLFVPVAVIPLLTDHRWIDKFVNFLKLTSPGFVLFFLNRMIVDYLYPVDEGIISQRFKADEIMDIIDIQGGLSGVFYMSYSALGPLLILLALSLIHIPSLWRIFTGLWFAVTIFQLLLASDTLRMVQALLPLTLLVVFCGLGTRFLRQPQLWYLTLFLATCAHITKSISRFDTRSTLAPDFLLGIPGDIVNVIILIPFLFLLILILRRPEEVKD